jgi:hypothetical protein
VGYLTAVALSAHSRNTHHVSRSTFHVHGYVSSQMKMLPKENR